MFALRRNVSSTLSRNFSTSAARNSFAKLTLVGRLADKPEITVTSSGTEIMKYAVATTSGRQNPKTSWFQVVSFQPDSPQRDFISNLEKGTLVYVEANARMEVYQDAEGRNKSSLNAVQQVLTVLQYRKREGEAGEGSEASEASE